MPSVYTTSDLTTVKNAIIELASGARTVTVTYAGPPSRSITYAAAQLPQLRELLSEIQRDLNNAPTYRRTSFNKGFDPNNPGGSGISG